jgi:hypothetical protein
MSQEQDIYVQANILLPEICAVRKEDHDILQDAQRQRVQYIKVAKISMH